MKKLAVMVAALGMLAFGFSAAEAAPKYVGAKKCGGCHKSQKESWMKTKHAKAMDVLAAGKEEKAKTAAKLDVKKDYTNDDKCVDCHTTGKDKGVSCENCHGAGSDFRKEHRKASAEFEKSGKKTPRAKLVKAGQNFDYEQACNKCHMNYEGSPWKGAKEPYTPFTPKVDKKYAFDFNKAVKETKAMHEHFKLSGVFEGDEPKIRAEFQKNAKEPAKGDDEGED